VVVVVVGWVEKVGSGVEEMLEVGVVVASSAESSSAAWVLLRLRLGPRGVVDDFVFFILLSEERILGAAGLTGVGFEEAVRPAVTFLMALMPTVLLGGLEAAGLGAGAVEDGGRTGGGVGIWMVIWVDVFMPMTRRLLTSS
jgi:hypothetical protein